MSSARAERNDDLRVALTQPGAGVGAGVALVALSNDGSLLDALDAVVTADHAINIVASEDLLAEQILSARCGVALIDAEATTGTVDHLAVRLRTQFPDLVLIIAGRDAHQAALAGLIASGVIYRFLHKPVSTQRVKQFVDAALRRHDEEHADVSLSAAPRGAVAKSARVSRPSPLLLGVAALALLAIAVGVYALRSRSNAPVAARLPAATEAVTGDAQLNKLLADAEKALVQGRAGDASTLLDAARRLQPDNIRVAFLTGQLGKERERAMLSRARSAAANGDFNQALAALDGSAPATGGSTTVAETRRDLERQQVEERVRVLLRRAGERLQSGAIAQPEGDNALFQLDAALALAPRDPAVLKLEQLVNRRILGEARAVATRGDGAGAASWLKLASARGLPAGEIESVRSTLNETLGNARNAEIGRLSASINELINRARSDDNALENAATYLATLRSFEGNGPATRAAQERLAGAQLSRARFLLDAGRLEDSQKALSDAQSLGATAETTAPVSAALAAQRARAQAESNIIGAKSLKRLRSPAPDYPPAALANNQNGWVDLLFVIRVDGSVSDPKVVAAEPAGIFEKAATDSIVRWRFAPVLRDGKPVEQRARLRVRFAIN